MANFENLPSDVLSKLAELDLELSEGDITQQGYEKKKLKLLTPYMSTNKDGGNIIPSPSTAAQRKAQRRLTRVDNRYHSEIRKEAVMQALAMNKKASIAPMPSKRTSALYRPTPLPPSHNTHNESSSDDDESVMDEDSSRESFHANQGNQAAQDLSNHTPTSTQYQKPPPRSNSGQPGSALADVVQIYGQAPCVSQPPDLTKNVNQSGSSKHNPNHAQSARLTDSRQTKVSAKIQQLLNTLKRPKRKPLIEYFVDEEDSILEMPVMDPSAPKPEGSIITPTIGEQLIVPSGLSRNLEAALHRYGSSSSKAPIATVLDPNGKPSITLLYSKLLSYAHKIAYNLLHKVGAKGEGSVKPGDRVALVYPNNEPHSFLVAFYGCLTAGVIPVPLEVPLLKRLSSAYSRDTGEQGLGFLLGSLGVTVAMTSEACYKGLPRTNNGEVSTFRGWPHMQWFVTEGLNKPPKDWMPPPRPSDNAPAYIEYAIMKDGSVTGVSHTRASVLSHCRALNVACNYTEGETMICVVDFKRDVGLWHSVLSSVFNGMHVVFIPYSIMKVDPASWMKMVVKFKASIAIVKSRDLHWGLLAQKEHKDIHLSSLKMLLVADGANPWSLTSCDSFLKVFQNRGLKPEAICPCAFSTEAATVSIRRPGKTGANTSGRGVLSMHGLSHGVVRVDNETSLTSLTLQDSGQVLPGGSMVVLKLDDPPTLCKTDEVGELCLSASFTGSAYWGLSGLSNNVFKVSPVLSDGKALSDNYYVRSGLLGFLGPGGLIFVCGSCEGLMEVGGRRHNTDDLIATVLAVEPQKFIYRGRVAVFSMRVLRDERVVIIAEQRPECTEEESFQWMSRVLQAVDSIHQVGVYCLALLPPNHLPKTSLGGIDLSEARRRFSEGSLHPVNVLMCPHTCVLNLPKPREHHNDVTPSAVYVGSIVQGVRLATAQGRDLGLIDDVDNDNFRKYQFLSEILKSRSTSTPDHILYTLVNSKQQSQSTLSCIQLHKKAERIGALLNDKLKLAPSDHVALLYPPGLELVCAFYGCLYAGVVPVTIRPPHPLNISTTLPTVKMIVDVSKAAVVLSTNLVIKMIRSKEATSVVDLKSWPTIVETDDVSKRRFQGFPGIHTPDSTCYIDFSVSTTGMLAGVKMTHASISTLCKSLKLQSELYPSREVVLCLDPYSGLGFVLWCMSSIYSGHHSILIPPSDVEVNPALWLSVVSQNKVRDTFCSYGVMELCTKGLGGAVMALKSRGVNLSCVRTLCVVAEERPRIHLTTSFSKLFSSLGLSARAVSTSFGCKVNVGICLQGASSPDPTSVYIDLRALRNDRVTLVERGSPQSLCLLESGKLMPGVKVVIANPETKGQCADSHLGEIWVGSTHNSGGYQVICEGEQENQLKAHLATGDCRSTFARTGYLGFIRRTEMTQSDGERHDAIFVVGSLEETMMLRGMRYHPIDIENSTIRCHRKICESAVFTWTNLLVVVVELDGSEKEALDLIPLVTNAVLEDHYLIVGVVVILDPGVVPINSRGEKQRMHLRDGFLADQLDPIYVAYNM